MLKPQICIKAWIKYCEAKMVGDAGILSSYNRDIIVFIEAEVKGICGTG